MYQLLEAMSFSGTEIQQLWPHVILTLDSHKLTSQHPKAHSGHRWHSRRPLPMLGKKGSDRWRIMACICLCCCCSCLSWSRRSWRSRGCSSRRRGLSLLCWVNAGGIISWWGPDMPPAPDWLVRGTVWFAGFPVPKPWLTAGWPGMNPKFTHS